MSENKNSAFRIKLLLEQAKRLNTKKTMEVWVDVFKIKNTDNHKIQFEVSRCLNILHDEVELLRSEMKRTEFSNYLYDSSFNRINNIIGINALNAEWEPYKKQIMPEVVLCLGFCSEILPPDEADIPTQELEEIEQLLSSLESSIEDSSLPSYTKRIIQKHIVNIKQAMESYTIVGARAFNKVVQSAYGEVIDNVAVFEESKTDKNIGKLATIWKKVKAVSDASVVVEKGMSASGKIAEHSIKAIEFIQNLGS